VIEHRGQDQCGNIMPLSFPTPNVNPPVTLRLPSQSNSRSAPSEQAAEGSGLLSELQLSLRTECAYPPLPKRPRARRGPPQPLSEPAPSEPAHLKSQIPALPANATIRPVHPFSRR
jgi:hypothetical protein